MKLIVNAAITGCVLSKKECPSLPVTVEEIVDCVQAVVAEGASIVHLHARQPDGSPSHRAEDYIEFVEAIRRVEPEVVVCVSLSGRFSQDLDQRAAPLQSKPDMASLTLGSLNFPKQPSLNSPQTIVALAEKIRAAGAVPELEVFEPGFIHYAKHLIEKGTLLGPHYFNLILGSLGSAPLDLAGLAYMVGLLPPGSTWSVGGIGRYQLAANTMAISAGGHVRVGLEDNPYYDWTTRRPTDNVELVKRVVRIARELGREPATPGEVRKMLGLPIRTVAAL